MVKINMEYRKGILFIRLIGDITKLTYENLTKSLIKIIKDNGIKYLVLNLGYINIIDNYGKNALKNIISEIKENKGKGLICNSKYRFGDSIKVVSDEIMAFNLLKV